MNNNANGNASRAKPPAVAFYLLLIIAFVKLVIHFATNSQYGFFRDELYYIDWSRHLGWGYVEQPPFTALAVYITRSLLGESLWALRFLPAVSGAVIVFFSGLIARELGGGRFAQGLAAVLILVGPTFLANHALMTMNVFDQLFWIICSYLIARLVRTGNPRLWYVTGFFAGIGLMTKLTMPFFLIALLISMLLTSLRKHFASKEFWLGAIIAFVIFLPFIIWMAFNDWAPFQFMFSYGGGEKTYQAGFVEWLLMHVITLNPFTLPIWIAGLWFFFFTKTGGQFRVFGWLFVILYAVFFMLKAKFYFLSPAFPLLLAGGAILFERKFNTMPWKWIKPVYTAILLITGMILAPLTLPIFPVETQANYIAAFEGAADVKTEQGEIAELPQHFADQFGWEEMVKGINDVYIQLPPDDQEKCVIIASNYGEAAAVNFYGPELGLPRAISWHNMYHLWGYGNFDGEIAILIVDESNLGELRENYEEVSVEGRNECKYCMPFERKKVFAVCRNLTMPVDQMWEEKKNYF